MDLQDLPARLLTSEVLKLARFGTVKLRQKQIRGEFPQPIDRGKQNIYARDQVLEALGLIDQPQRNAENDPFRKGLETLGRNKR
jgi:hypothetical protein